MPIQIPLLVLMMYRQWVPDMMANRKLDWYWWDGVGQRRDVLHLQMKYLDKIIDFTISSIEDATALGYSSMSSKDGHLLGFGYY